MVYHAIMWNLPQYRIEAGDWLRMYIPAARTTIRLDVVRANDVTELALVRNDIGVTWWTSFSALRSRWSPGSRAEY